MEEEAEAKRKQAEEEQLLRDAEEAARQETIRLEEEEEEEAKRKEEEEEQVKRDSEEAALQDTIRLEE